jgi:hypothetical protein
MASVAFAVDVRDVVDKPLARVPAFAPVAAADWLMYRLGRRVTGILDGVSPDAVDDFSEEDFCAVVESIEAAKHELDWYLSVRGDRGLLRTRVRQQRDRIAEALYCLRRGYAPGHMPSVSDRMALGKERLREVT